MSNLGFYQTMTTMAKKVGGPLQLALLVGTGGYFVCRIAEAGVKKFAKTVKTRKVPKENASISIYEIHTAGTSNDGLTFAVGDSFRVLSDDSDVVLIEKIGNKNNPYHVSADFLHSISNF